MFDPYRRWLSIPEDRRPPTHYQLLGVASDETELEVIEAAVLRQSAYVRNFQVGKYADDAARILNEIAAAKICLLNPKARAAYDAELRKQGRLDPPPHETPVAPLAPEQQPHYTPTPARVVPPPGGRPQAGPPQATRPQRAAPAIDLDALAGQAGLSGRRTRQPRVRLTTRSKQNTIPPHYWLIPAGAAVVMLVIVLVLTLGKRTGPEQRGDAQARPLDGQIVEESAAPSPSDDEPAAPNASSPDQLSANSRKPQEEAPGLSPIAGAMPAAQADGLSGSNLPGSDLPGSEKDSGSPAEFPGETDGGDSRISIPLPPRDPFIVFAQGTGRFVAAGQTVYDSQTGEIGGKTGAFQARSRDSLRALSADGKLYASASEAGSSGIEVRSCETGEWRCTLHLDKAVLALKLLEFGGADRLISSPRFDDAQRVQVWDLASGERIKEFRTANFNRPQAALSPSGEALAVATGKGEIVIYDVRRSVDNRPGEVLARIPLAPADEDVVSVDGLSFSPDGGELVAVVDGGARILGWNERGELLFEYASNVDLRALWTGACVYQGPAIEWRPGGGGWLLNGHFFFDRNLRRVIWMLQTDRDEEARMKFLDEERLLLLRGEGAERRLADISIPWNKIGQALAAVQADAPRYLGPGGAISLEVNIGQLLEGAAKDQVGHELEKMAAARFKAEGIRIAEDQPTVLRLFYSERAMRSPGAAGGESMNQCDLKLRLWIADGVRHVWAANVVAESKAAGSAARLELYYRLSSRLHQTPVPYFIPKSSQLTSLPAIIRP